MFILIYFQVMQNLQNYLQTEDAKQQEAALGVLQKQQVCTVIVILITHL